MTESCDRQIRLEIKHERMERSLVSATGVATTRGIIKNHAPQINYIYSVAPRFVRVVGFGSNHN